VSPAARFAERLGLPIRDLGLLEQALVHSSYLHEHPETASGNNERLELLGDAVVNLAVSEALYSRHPDDDEGMLSARRAAIVSTAGLARLAHRLDLGRELLLGEGERKGGRLRASLLAASFEALVGAVYLDLGWAATRDWLVGLASPEIRSDAPASSLKSPKSALQEFTQRSSGGRPVYRVVEASGPDHDKMFRIEAVVDGDVVGEGEGSSRRIAETAAAAQAIETLLTRRAAGTHHAGVPDPAPDTDPAPDAGPDGSDAGT
jgi:ribonuclease III